MFQNNNGFDRRDISGSSRGQRYGDESIVEIRMKYNLYRGGSDRAAERAAFQRINQAEDLRDKACVDLRQTASIAHSDIGNLKIKQDALKATVMAPSGWSALTVSSLILAVAPY